MRDYQPSYVKLALPKGRFLSPTANLLTEIDLGFEGYSNKARQYRLQSVRLPYLSAKIFQEKDIPIQVAIGNYDLGICGLDWIEELLVKYPAGALVKISSLNYGEGSVHVVASNQAGVDSLDELLPRQNDWRIVSEYPNLAEAFALNRRMRRFRIFPVWGAAEVYPPENANLAILWGKNESDLEAQGLVSLTKLFPVTAFLIANRESLENKDLSLILTCLSSRSSAKQNASMSNAPNEREISTICYSEWQAKEIKLALPDGHQRLPTSQFLKRAGLDLPEYSKETMNRRPSVDLDWLGIKVIRPQDMPLQVANGNFDLAITGEDWLREQLYRFPSSPITKLLTFAFGKVKIVAAVTQDMPVTNIDELRSLVQSGESAHLRVASEYINISDKYLRENHINPYKLIPTWGASEAFLPDDADILIDNTQTGKTLKQHNLKIIDVLFQSSACLIGNKDSLDSPDKKEKMEFLAQMLQAGLLTADS
jgi:ATP phosphoribosyltransferase